jgi:PAS domain S-box-containing protein
MGASPPADWHTRLTRALELDDPIQARAQARRMLAEIRDEEARLRERLEMLSAASFEGILVHVDGNVIDANRRLCEMLGYELEEVLGPRTLRRCVAPEDLTAVQQRMASHYEGAYVITGVRKDGSRFRAELQSKQGQIGRRPVRFAAVRDVMPSGWTAWASSPAASPTTSTTCWSGCWATPTCSARPCPAPISERWPTPSSRPPSAPPP